jgi:hypothetical protein
MGRNTPNGNEESGPRIEYPIHLVLQGKGGVGKSVVASWLAEFLTRRGTPLRCIDGDPVNRSLAQYKALAAERFELMNQDGLIERWRYDALVECFATTEAVFVLDSGATAFLPLWGYMVESEMIRVLGEAGKKVYLHIPITGGETLNDTLLGFSTIASAAPDKSIVLWLNEYFGPVARDGKKLAEMQVYIDNREKVLASIGIPQRSPDTYGQTVRAMRERKLTFEEAIGSTEFMLAQKSRLHIVRRDLFEQLERAPFA